MTDLNRRPTTYWDDPKPLRPTPEQREAMLQFGKMHPAFMGGAYLLEPLEGEVEIARVALRSTTGDVLSVSARPVDGRIAYRVVDEYDVTWVVPSPTSEKPLTLGEMVRLLHETYMQEEPDVRGIAQGFRERNNCAAAPETAHELIDFVEVRSDFYPELSELDRAEATAWANTLG